METETGASHKCHRCQHHQRRMLRCYCMSARKCLAPVATSCRLKWLRTKRACCCAANQLHGNRGGQVCVLTASINAAVAAFQAAHCWRALCNLYQNIADLIGHVSGDSVNVVSRKIILASGVSPSEAETLAHKPVVLAAVDLAHV